MIPEKIAEPLSYESHKPPEVLDTKEIKLQHMLDFFIRYMNFDNLGKIANSHLALADQSPKLAFDERCLRLSELHSDAVDFVKTGYCVEKIEAQLLAKEWPDFMEKKDYLLIYESKTILGELYREIKAIIKGKKETGEISSEKTELDKDYKLDLDLVYGYWEEFIEEAYEIFDNFHAEMDGLMNLFNIRNEFEVYSGNFSKFTKEERKGKVNVELLQKRVLDNIAMIKQKYIAMFKKDLADKDNKELTKEERETLRTKASAIYIISYLNIKHTENEEYQTLFKKVFSYKRWRNFEESRERVVGLPWMVVSDWLIEIKQQKMKNDEKKRRENGGNEKEKGLEIEEEKEGMKTVSRVEDQNSDEEDAEYLTQNAEDKNKKKK